MARIESQEKLFSVQENSLARSSKNNSARTIKANYTNLNSERKSATKGIANANALREHRCNEICARRDAPVSVAGIFVRLIFYSSPSKLFAAH